MRIIIKYQFKTQVKWGVWKLTGHISNSNYQGLNSIQKVFIV